MLIVLAEATCEPGNRARLEAEGAAMIEASRAEAGCLGYAYSWDFLQPGVMRAVELWQDEEALRFHFRTPHMARFLAALAEMGNPPPRITVQEAGEAHPIGRYMAR